MPEGRKIDRLPLASRTVFFGIHSQGSTQHGKALAPLGFGLSFRSAVQRIAGNDRHQCSRAIPSDLGRDLVFRPERRELTWSEQTLWRQHSCGEAKVEDETQLALATHDCSFANVEMNNRLLPTSSQRCALPGISHA